MMKILEKLSTVAVIGVALLFGFVLVKDHLLQGSAATIAVPSQAPQAESKLKGQHITLERVDWNESRFSIILALSTNCHFCTESAPFYRRLAAQKETSANAFRLFTVFPQEVEAAEDYLKQNKVTPDAVFSLKQTNIDVNGTPTLLLVDSQGIVQQVWVGKLTESAEQEVLDSLRATASRTNSVSGQLSSYLSLIARAGESSINPSKVMEDNHETTQKPLPDFCDVGSHFVVISSKVELCSDNHKLSKRI